MPDTQTKPEFTSRPDAYDAISDALIAAEYVALYGHDAEEEGLEALLEKADRALHYLRSF